MVEVVQYRVQFKLTDADGESIVDDGCKQVIREKLLNCVAGYNVSVGHFAENNKMLQSDLWFYDLDKCVREFIIKSIERTIRFNYNDRALSIEVKVIFVNEYVDKKTYEKLNGELKAYDGELKAYKEKTGRGYIMYMCIIVCIILVVCVKICFNCGCKAGDPEGKTVQQTSVSVEKNCLPVRDTLAVEYLRRMELKLNDIYVKCGEVLPKPAPVRRVARPEKGIVIQNNLSVGTMGGEVNIKKDTVIVK
ncbi:hypothetical protein [uncultured Alistipes sp.]|uniref:hypothetical protein n=1 Tax=uncultured Alistipes sp. TaxID=538949 RepID=UPI002599A311|nr:hypothetical protein [uncultured Alistipes sp.]